MPSHYCRRRKNKVTVILQKKQPVIPFVEWVQTADTKPVVPEFPPLELVEMKNKQFHVPIMGDLIVRTSPYDRRNPHQSTNKKQTWVGEPMPCLGIETGTVSGIVGLVFTDWDKLAFFEKEYGPLPYPRLYGKNILICYDAPVWKAKSKKLMTGVRFIGEGGYLIDPPSVRKQISLKCLIGQMKLSQGLPSLPWWLYY